MKSVVRFAEGGGKVLGICNGFQILLESGLLPGAMLRNKGLKFICRPQHIRVETIDTPFTRACESGRVLSVPIAHHDGNYFADDETLARLKAEDRVVFRYCDADGTVGAASNPNGSADHIAGICNAGRNVVGLMPHPERAVEAIAGSDDGRLIFASLL
jgi:phosphoribosylformylglycinamidine synthase